jgi:hypothetical protein
LAWVVVDDEVRRTWTSHLEMVASLLRAAGLSEAL